MSITRKLSDIVFMYIIKGFMALSKLFILPQILIVQLEFNDNLYYFFNCNNSVYSNGTTPKIVVAIQEQDRIRI